MPDTREPLPPEHPAYAEPMDPRAFPLDLILNGYDGRMVLRIATEPGKVAAAFEVRHLEVRYMAAQLLDACDHAEMHERAHRARNN